MSLEIRNLQVSAKGGLQAKEILHEISLIVPKGKVIAIMGPNGSGKSTLANTLAGHPKYTVAGGSILIDGDDITNAKPDERAKKGLFLSMQHTPEIAGVTVANFLRMSKQAATGATVNPIKFYKELEQKMAELKMDSSFLSRHLNVGFSGGEKKRFELLQLLVLNPTYVILDETDSGLDVDAFRVVAEGIQKFRSTEKGILIITHYNKMLEHVVPDEVYVMVNGSIVKSGGKELAEIIEREGYDWLKN